MDRRGGGSGDLPHDDTPPAETLVGLSAAWQAALLLALFCVTSLFLYREAFEGAFFSDDYNNIVNNEYIHHLTAGNLRELVRPGGAPARLTQNYAPLHLLAHAAEWATFGDRVFGYHVVNALLHGVASFLLVALFACSGVQRWAAVVGGACFLVHPANVEAVAWVYQLKTVLALILALLALLLFDRRPVWAFAFFAAAILSKALAAFALPVAVALLWARQSAASGPAESAASPDSGPAAGARHTGAWLIAWALFLLAFAWSAFGIFASTNANVPPLHQDPWGVARTVVAIGGRYLAMASSGYGVSAFQEVPLAESWLDPWWLASALLLGVLGWRGAYALARRREEGAYWLWAVCSFVPISQVFPFLHPMADRYLYFILPGLLGGALLGLQSAGLAGLVRPGVRGPRVASGVALAVVVLALGLLSARSIERVRLWRYPVLLEKDAIARYPNGLLANNARAREAAAAGDADAALAALWMTVERGDLRYRELLGDPAWSPVRADPRFRAMVAEMAQRRLDLLPRYRDPSQIELYGFAEAAALLTQYDLAEQLLMQALEVGGIRDEAVRSLLDRVRRARSEEAQVQRPEESAP